MTRSDPTKQAFVHQAIASGGLCDEEEAVQEALPLWEQRERLPAELAASVESDGSVHARGEGRPVTPETMRQPDV